MAGCSITSCHENPGTECEAASTAQQLVTSDSSTSTSRTEVEMTEHPSPTYRPCRPTQDMETDCLVVKTELPSYSSVVDKFPEPLEDARQFQPVCPATRRLLAAQFGLQIYRLGSLGRPGRLGTPKRLHDTEEDGNCFFRAVSYALTGMERHHLILRKLVVKHMRHQIRYQVEDYLNQPVLDYMKGSKMASDGTWATDAEILSTAALLGVDIVVYTRLLKHHSWLTYPASFNLQQLSEESLYLMNSGFHFYLVVGM